MEGTGDQLDSYIEGILTDKRLPETIGDDVRRQMHSDIRERLADEIDRAVIEEMPETSIDEMNELLDKNPDAGDEDIQAIISRSGVDVATVAARTMALFRELYLGNLDVVSSAEETGVEE